MYTGIKPSSYRICFSIKKIIIIKKKKLFLIQLIISVFVFNVYFLLKIKTKIFHVDNTESKKERELFPITTKGEK